MNLNQNFKYWFIGFSEGDGPFIITKKNYLEFKITQSSKDAQILFYIKKQLKFGSVSVQSKTSKTHHFRVRKKESILKLINIFNGNLLTEKKTKQFKIWVQTFNNTYKDNIQVFQCNNDPILNNAWLSGFTDAEGCFTVTCIERSKTYVQVQVRYIISQQNEQDLLLKISKLFDGRVHYLKSYDGYNMTVNLLKLKKVIKYFNKYILKTKKYIDYLNWIKVYELVISKIHFTEEGLNQIKNLIKKINK